MYLNPNLVKPFCNENLCYLYWPIGGVSMNFLGEDPLEHHLTELLALRWHQQVASVGIHTQEGVVDIQARSSIPPLWHHTQERGFAPCRPVCHHRVWEQGLISLPEEVKHFAINDLALPVRRFVWSLPDGPMLLIQKPGHSKQYYAGSLMM